MGVCVRLTFERRLGAGYFAVVAVGWSEAGWAVGGGGVDYAFSQASEHSLRGESLNWYADAKVAAFRNPHEMCEKYIYLGICSCTVGVLNNWTVGHGVSLRLHSVEIASNFCYIQKMCCFTILHDIQPFFLNQSFVSRTRSRKQESECYLEVFKDCESEESSF